MIRIYSTFIKRQLEVEEFRTYLDSLPNSISEKILAFRRWQDQHSGLFGKLLLKRGLEDLGQFFDLSNIQHNKYGRPFIKGCIDFNISHSGSWVVCAFSEKGTIGVDIEEIKPIDIQDFSRQFNKEEWKAITRASDVHSEFYKYWTLKEAVVKSMGEGLSVPLENVSVKPDNSIAVVDQMRLNISTFYLNENYIGGVASTATLDTVDFFEIDFNL